MLNGRVMECELCVGRTQLLVLTPILIIVHGHSLTLQHNLWVIQYDVQIGSS